jgi:hypothetical protein
VMLTASASTRPSSTAPTAEHEAGAPPGPSRGRWRRARRGRRGAGQVDAHRGEELAGVVGSAGELARSRRGASSMRTAIVGEALARSRPARSSPRPPRRLPPPSRGRRRHRRRGAGRRARGLPRRRPRHRRRGAGRRRRRATSTPSTASAPRRRPGRGRRRGAGRSVPAALQLEHLSQTRAVVAAVEPATGRGGAQVHEP